MAECWLEKHIELCCLNCSDSNTCFYIFYASNLFFIFSFLDVPCKHPLSLLNQAECKHTHKSMHWCINTHWYPLSQSASFCRPLLFFAAHLWTYWFVFSNNAQGCCSNLFCFSFSNSASNFSLKQGWCEVFLHFQLFYLAFSFRAIHLDVLRGTARNMAGDQGSSGFVLRMVSRAPSPLPANLLQGMLDHKFS